MTDTYNAEDQATVDNQAKEAARRNAQDSETFRVWMNHPHGRDLLFRLVYEICHLGETYAAVDAMGHSDTHKTYLHLGERNIGAYLDERMRKHPELYMQMLKEAEIEAELRRSRIEGQNKPQGEDNNGGSALIN